MDDSFYVPSLKTVLTDTQTSNVRDLRTTLSRERGVIYSRFCGSGKTLSILTYLLSEGLDSENKRALVAAPPSALKAWIYNSRVHFNPHIECVQLDKNSKNRLLDVSLNRFQIVVVNFETLVGSYENACELRKRILKEELDALAAEYPSWKDTAEMSELDREKYNEAEEKQRQIFLYYRSQQEQPAIREDIPFPYLAEREENARRRSSRMLDYLFRHRWEWLVMDEAHEGRNRYRSLYSTLMTVAAEKRIAMTATICSNGISDFVSMLDLVGQTPSEGWKNLSNSSSKCIAYMNETKRRCVVYSPLEEDKAIERLYHPTSILVHVSLGEEERRAYQETIEFFKKKNEFSKISKLRQQCDGPSKTQAILTYLERCVVAHGEKAVIFTGFVEYTEQLGRSIRKRFPSVKLVVVTGKTDQKKRATTLLDEVARYRGSAVYLVTIKIMSLGVDMHFANHAIIASPWWNPTTSEQAMRRLTRPQQKLAVRWVTFVMRDTVEEGVDLVAHYKNKLNTRLLEGDIDESMLEQITSRCAMQRARKTANRLREALLTEEEESEQTLMQSAAKGDTESILKLIRTLSPSESLKEVYRERFDVVMDCEDEIALERAPPIDLSSQITTQIPVQPVDALRQQEIDRMLRKRKKGQEEAEKAKRQRAHLSLLERQENLEKKPSGRQTKVVDLFGNIVFK